MKNTFKVWISNTHIDFSRCDISLQMLVQYADMTEKRERNVVVTFSAFVNILFVAICNNLLSIWQMILANIGHAPKIEDFQCKSNKCVFMRQNMVVWSNSTLASSQSTTDRSDQPKLDKKGVQSGFMPRMNYISFLLYHCFCLFIRIIFDYNLQCWCPNCLYSI